MLSVTMGEPDVISNTNNSSTTSGDNYGPNVIRLNVTDQMKELQTVLRDRSVTLLTVVIISEGTASCVVYKKTACYVSRAK